MTGRRTERGPRRGSVSRGFSLVEILVAFTVLTLFAATAFQVFSSGVRSAALAVEYAKAHTVARSKMDELAASPTLVSGEQSGKTAIGGAQPLRWRTAVTEYPLPSGRNDASESLPTPLLAVVEVTWGDNGLGTASHRFELRALLLGRLR